MSAFYDPDEALARVEADIAAAQERASAAQEVRAKIDEVRGVARSERGEVVAQVDPTGLLRDLELSDAATRLRADALSTLIVRTVRAAMQDASRQAVAIMDDAFGAGSAVSRQLQDELDQRMR
ncbi:YbaB/EbfC family nucleoid-associated protein [Beutenbergia cavernae]|nr:YbaB/EbfC family nucleoid-associated protein [Beutenbergia cavernae]